MSESRTKTEEVFLEMEGKTLRCNRKTLMEESDYFKAMFEGDFIESHQKIVKLNDVSFRAVEVILTLFWDERYVIHSDDVLLVLEAACMLQFLRIKQICVNKILNEMSTRNCFEIWRVCEFLDIKPLYVKAKAKALSEFSTIAREDFIYQLDLRWFCRYVANRNLECQNELEVFQCCMRWFYENCNAEKEEILFVLLGCLDFNALSAHDLHEMKAYPDILAYATLANTINCVIDIKENVILRCDDTILSRARVFLDTKKRIVQHCVCFMASLRTERLLKRIQDQFVVHFCDPKKDKIHLLFEVDNQKISRYMRGYRLIAYKELIFVIGGQHELGLREFVKNVWVYDLFKEKWERSTLLPFLRRDFDVCLSGDNMFIIGGSGEYASVQNNLFWYNCSLNLWSEKMDLPIRGDDLKVCAYKNRLFLLSVSTTRAYIFNPIRKVFTKVELCGEINALIMEDFTLFSYKDEIYFKGRQLLRTRVETQHLTIVERLLVAHIPSEHSFSVLSDDCLYTFYVEDNKFCTLEKFNVVTLQSTLILDRHDFAAPLSVEQRTYDLREIPNLFLLQHYGLVEEDEFVTDYFLNAREEIFNKDG